VKVRNACEEDTIYFNSERAREVGVVGAVLVGNFEYWIAECEKRGIKDKRVLLQPAILEELLPFEKRTIRRGIQELVTAGFIQQVPGKLNWYVENIQSKGGTNLDKGRTNLDRDGAYLDKGGTNLDNDTSCKSISNLLEHSKGNAPRSSLECPEDETNKTNSLVYSQQVTNSRKDDGHSEPLVRHDESILPSPVFTDSLMGHEGILSTTVFFYIIVLFLIRLFITSTNR